MRIAVVGSGISGLVAARVLSRRNDVHVFEADDRIGGHTHTVDVAIGDRIHAVDTGFIVYNEDTYPSFTRLLAQLGVSTQPSDMSFGLRCDRTGLEWGSLGLAGVFAQRRNLLRPSFHRMLRDVFRLGREGPALIDSGDEKVTLGDFLHGGGYSQTFVEHYVLPMGAAIWSASPTKFLDMPARSFVRFFANHGLLGNGARPQWRVLSGGSRQYLAPLTAPFRDRIRTRCPVDRIRRDHEGVRLHAAGREERFDRVVLAVHSDQALRLLEDPSAAERAILGSIGYQRNDVVLHTDRAVMPRSKRAWASWNYRIPPRSQDAVFVSYHMNRLQGLDLEQDLFVTLNGGEAVDSRQVIDSFVYHHPVFDAAAIRAQHDRHLIEGVRKTHYCGAWWGYGFHEDGVRSALEVCRGFGLSL
jgi:predicted NAD/FAD-binding protein